MAADDCIRSIREAAGFDLTDDQIEDILVEMDRRARAKKAGGSLAVLEDRILEAAGDMAREITEAGHIERRNALINIKTLARVTAYLREVDQLTGNPALALRAMTVGVNTPIPNARASVDARAKAMASEYMGGMLADLKRENLLPLMNSGEMDRDIARELAELSKKQGEPGISKSREALAVAKIIDKYRRVAVARENRAGASIRPLEGYVVRQSHDMHRIRRAGFEAWRDAILPRLHGKTFEGVEDVGKFLKGAYDGIVTGRHLKANGGAENDLPFAFKGPGNLAKKVSEHRVLHFKSADDWMDYNDSFGQRSLMEAVVGDMDRAARNTALMEAFGTNPRAMFERIRQDALDTSRGDLAKFDALSGQRIGWEFDEIEGLTRAPVNPSSAALHGTVRAVQSMAKLGGATLSAISDVAFKASEIRYQGHGLLDAWGQSLTTLVEGVAPGAQRETAELIGVGLEGQMGDMASRFSATDSLPGQMSKWQQRFFKFSLLAPWTDANKRGVGLMMSRDLAMKKRWAELDGATKRMLGMYGIDGPRWDVVRKAVRKEADGREYLMPDAVRDLADEDLAPLLSRVTARDLSRLRDDLETALRSYYVDRVDFAVPTPGASERALLTMGTRPGTPLGEAVRYVMQFKAFPITAISKPMGAMVYGRGAGSLKSALLKGEGDILGLVHLMVASTVMGYVAQSAKEMAKGRSPRDPADPGTWTAAFLQGGGAGIYGDFVFGEFNRFGRSALSTAAGPTFGSADDLLELWARFRNGDDTAAAAVRFATSNTPYLNLFYTRAAIDYLFLYQLQESINPGYLRRMEQRIKKDQGQTFIYPPSQYAVR